MKKIKDINWFWKNWTESEKRIYKKCVVFAIIFVAVEIMLAIMCVNKFHASEIPADGGSICPPGWHQETKWNDEKGEWYSVYVPNDYSLDKYEVDADGTLYIFHRIFNIIYSTLLPLASVMACTLVGYNYCMIMTSKNPRKIDDSYTHIKVIATTWLYIMCASVFITLGMQTFNQMINSPFANPILKP